MKNTTDDKKILEVKEDTEDKSILNSRTANEDNKYPRRGEKDKQFKTQPEFIDRQSDSKKED